jgi:Flp pilus assembly protein CpaB
MKPKTIILLVVAVGCGLGASIMTSRLLADRRKSEEPEATTTIVVAKIRVTGWTAIKDPEKDFEVREVPEAFAHKRGMTTLAELKDQKLNKTIPDGHVLLRDDLLTKEQASIIEQLLPGQRAVAVRVNAESVAGGFVLPAARVDVMCTMTGNESSAKLILQNMLVMAVDDIETRNPDKKSIVPATVTLAATPEEAGRLALAAKLGELRLLPRSPVDSSRIAQFEVKPEDLKRQPRDNSSSKGSPDDVVKAEPIASPVLPLPPLPPVEEKKAEPKLVEEPRLVAKVAEPKKPSKHTLRIIQGTTTVKAVFNLDEKREEDEEEGIVSKPEPKAETKPVAKPEPKPEVKPAAKAEPKTTRVGRTRVGS